jgi:hypothetical protein
MPLRQYAYFALFSRHVSADAMTFQLGMTPDEVTVRGSRFNEPTAVPVDHSWMVVCREPGLRVDEQITRVLDRLQPHMDRISDLTKQLVRTGGGAMLHIVRYFNDTDQAHPGTADAPSLFGLAPGPKRPGLPQRHRSRTRHRRIRHGRSRGRQVST